MDEVCKKDIILQRFNLLSYRDYLKQGTKYVIHSGFTSFY